MTQAQEVILPLVTQLRAARERSIGRRLHAYELRWLVAAALPEVMSFAPPCVLTPACVADAAVSHALEDEACQLLGGGEQVTPEQLSGRLCCTREQARAVVRALLAQGRVRYAGAP